MVCTWVLSAVGALLDFEMQTKTQLKHTFESKESAPVNIRFTTRVREKYFLTFVPPREPAATYHGDRAKAVYLKTLLQSARMGNSRPTRALERELAAFAKLKGHFYPAIPATLERDKVQYPEAKPGGADLKADEQSSTPEDSMRQARSLNLNIPKASDCEMRLTPAAMRRQDQAL